MNTPESEFSTLSEITQYADLNDDDIFLTQQTSGGLQVPKKIEKQNFLNCNQLLCTSLTVTHANILLLNGTPQQLVAAPGAGKAIYCDKAYVKCDYSGGVVYATNTQLIILANGGREQLRSNSLNYNVDRYAIFENNGTPAAGQDQIIENTDVMLSVATGNPTGGAAGNEITVTLYYYIINI